MRLFFDILLNLFKFIEIHIIFNFFKLYLFFSPMRPPRRPSEPIEKPKKSLKPEIPDNPVSDDSFNTFLDFFQSYSFFLGVCIGMILLGLAEIIASYIISSFSSHENNKDDI